MVEEKLSEELTKEVLIEQNHGCEKTLRTFQNERLSLCSWLVSEIYVRKYQLIVDELLKFLRIKKYL